MAAVISIKNLNKVYKNGFQAVNDLNLEVDAGEFIALLGPNGAGKSTTIGILTTLVNKTSGQVFINGYDLTKDSLKAKAELGVVPQEFNFNPFETVEQILLNQASFQGIESRYAKIKIEQLLHEVDLVSKRKQAAQTLSGGMKRRLMIARALIHNPKVLILDEPTAGVDVEVRQSIYQFLEKRNKQGLTIILTTHYLEEAERLCSRIAIINHGKIIKDIAKDSLFKNIKKESIELHLSSPLEQLPVVDDYDLVKNSDYQIEAILKKNQDIASLVTQLMAKNILIERINNKANRLERVFMDIINENENEKVEAIA